MVKQNVINYNKINEGIEYHESTQRALAKIVKELPTLLKPLEEVVKHGNKQSKK